MEKSRARTSAFCTPGKNKSKQEISQINVKQGSQTLAETPQFYLLSKVRG